jgi:hypothetical protein
MSPRRRTGIETASVRRRIDNRHIERRVVPVRSALCRKVSSDAIDGNLREGG